MSIAQNKKALHDYFIEERFEAGLVLEGWEVKAIRAGRAQLKEGYVVIRNGELFLIGAHITALPEASTHIKPDPTRTRKLLLHALDLHYKGGRVKCEIGLAKGKKQYDKRETEREREWQRERQRLIKAGTRA
jgi:SsrA-binding protein